MHRFAVLICSVAMFAITPAASLAQSSSESVEDLVRKLQGELDAVREDNAQMRHELDQLRAETSDHWLTEARADEIRSLVSDVLADADTRASHLTDGLMAGWSDQFFLASADGRFKLELQGQLQTRFIWNYHDQPRRNQRGWETPRTRLTFKGHVFSQDIEYLVRVQAANGVSGQNNGAFMLTDSWVRMALDDEMSIRVGQFKIPFMREFLVDSSRQQAVDRTLINEAMSKDRSQGLEFVYATDQYKLSLATVDGGQDNGGLVNSNPINGAWNTVLSEFAVAARLEVLLAGTWGQFADFTSPPGDPFGALFGVAGFWQKDARSGFGTSGRDEVEWVGMTADISLEWGGANAFWALSADYYDLGFTAPHIWAVGSVLQAGYYVAPKVEVFGRFEYAWLDFDTNSNADLTLVTAGFTYFLDGHDLKWTTDLGVGISKIETFWASIPVGWRSEIDGAEPQVVFRTMLQLLF